jgi:hypothetical protein
VLAEIPENTIAESERTLLSSRAGWKHLDVLRHTGEVARSVWEVVYGFQTNIHFAVKLQD